MTASASASSILFLSTPSARRATTSQRTTASPSTDFYPRPPRGGRRHVKISIITADAISIHALREEGDAKSGETSSGGMQFLSTPSARRATKQYTVSSNSKQISIHALREEGDRPTRAAARRRKEFLSTPSARRATTQPQRPTRRRRFLSTPSARRATQANSPEEALEKISIHALREEGDGFSCTELGLWAISIHALREEGDA